MEDTVIVTETVSTRFNRKYLAIAAAATAAVVVVLYVRKNSSGSFDVDSDQSA